MVLIWRWHIVQIWLSCTQVANSIPVNCAPLAILFLAFFGSADKRQTILQRVLLMLERIKFHSRYVTCNVSITSSSIHQHCMQKCPGSKCVRTMWIAFSPDCAWWEQCLSNKLWGLFSSQNFVLLLLNNVQHRLVHNVVHLKVRSSNMVSFFKFSHLIDKWIYCTFLIFQTSISPIMKTLLPSLCLVRRRWDLLYKIQHASLIENHVHIEI
jgi:hypothetical protein